MKTPKGKTLYLVSNIKYNYKMDDFDPTEKWDIYKIVTELDGYDIMGIFVVQSFLKTKNLPVYVTSYITGPFADKKNSKFFGSFDKAKHGIFKMMFR
jgi:hypothetical protein